MQKANRVLLTKITSGIEQTRNAAKWVLRPAEEHHIVAALKSMQMLKGREYSEVAERMYGQQTESGTLTSVEQEICQTMKDRKMTLPDLAEMYKLAIETQFEYTRFAPLPDYTACIKLISKAQESTFRLRQAASDELDDNPVLDAIQQIGQHTESRTLPDLFSELKRKLE